MIAVNYTNIRENLKAYCDKVNDEDETVIITRKDNKNVVLISQNEYNNMLENIKILKDPKYLIKLYKSLSELENSDLKEIDS
ncbi:MULTISPECIES: type II toxin-antitoxin system Phd/YefM family antitoxin [Clostridium]|uniref:Antitoxin n=3 Tax=Clostridium TaxID=1485 RepID=A0A512TRK9_CLOBU|nr:MULTISPECIES: type II toxin-antitoxin system prevent-host-death family antitoxin [Clostridium]MRY42964.1 type II toxin-antitoxin system prevent-host-death family antitoxin [Parabacteroides distasonis]MBC2457772.1 type II toxin-antitoxin system Phd/YefM family antitoxin [Clostridium beijerinckii]MBC2475036.1 type II toxin-antitoxin system Phd/YefM family antitoxin [Clostridium beijerinckii]MDG5854930.1 type II toxin-antitoxin system prevent-host-death family antitoxin [Clostridium beijerincki